jgi:hypothetical protein
VLVAALNIPNAYIFVTAASCDMATDRTESHAVCIVLVSLVPRDDFARRLTVNSCSKVKA